MSTANRNFYQTTALVTFLSVFERFLGFLYRIILSRTIGSEGVGLYQVALSVFAVLVTVVSSGIPITLSRIITKHKAEGDLKGERASFTAGLLLTLALSLGAFALFFFGRDLFGFLFSDKRAQDVFVIMLFGLVFDCIYAVIRGSFWGNKQFLPYSLIELIEEAVMIIVGTLLVVKCSDVFSGAKSAGIAVVVSYACSFSIASVYFFLKGGRLASPKGEYRPLLSSAVPITAMRTSSSLINSFIAVLLPAQLMQCGMTSAEALSEFGVAFGMAIPVLFAPATLIGSVSLVLVPELSEDFYKGRYDRLRSKTENAIKLTTSIAFLAIPFLLVFGEDLGYIIFSNGKSGEMISCSSLMLLPMSLSMITTSMLNSLNLEKKTLLYYAIGSVALIACIFFLPKYMGSYSLMVGMSLSFIITSVLNLRLIDKTFIKRPRYLKHMLLCLVCAAISSVAAKLLYSLFNKLTGKILSLVFSIGLTGIISLVLYAVFSLIPQDLTKKLFKKKSDSY